MLGACAGERAAPEAPAPPPAPTPDGPWTAPLVPPQASLPGLSGLRAADCAPCHAEIVAEWRTSTHAAAWVDPQFQQELAKDPGVAWLCINCHTPAADQQERLHAATALVRSPVVSESPGFDPAFQAEGVSCMSCHWRPGGIAAPHEGGSAPHPTVFAPELRSAETCTGCHQAVARVEDTLVCTFNTGAEWAASGKDRACPACHMPEVTRSHATGAPPRAGGRHTFPGSLIPKKAAYTADELAIIGEWAPGTTLDAQVAGDAVEIVLTNARAGHMLPTGDPERQLYVRLVQQPGDQVRWEERIGQTWTWWPVAQRTADNRLAPGERRALRAPLPAGVPLDALELRVDHERISAENAAHHALSDYARMRTVHRLPLTAARAPAD